MTVPGASVFHTRFMSNPNQKIASIDIGSNTLRLLIVEKTPGGLKPVFRDREIVRLGKGFFPSRRLSTQSIEGALRVLKRFMNKADQEGVTQVRAVGTGVLREAQNRGPFLERIAAETGLAVEIISGLEEARIMARGVLAQLQVSTEKTVVFDMGGGSTEFVFLIQGEPADKLSLPIGVVGLTERFLLSDPPTSKELDSLLNYCRIFLKENLPQNGIIKNLIGTAGTVTTLAAMDQKLTEYDPDRINGAVLTRDRLGLIAGEILSIPFSRRAKLPGLEPGRADIIGAGILLVIEILDHFSLDSLRVSDAGLLEGLVL